MKIINKEKIEQKFSGNIKLADNYPVFESEPEAKFNFTIPKEGRAMLAFSGKLVHCCSKNFKGGYFAVAQNGIWSEWTEQIGLEMLKSFISDFNEIKPNEKLSSFIVEISPDDEQHLVMLYFLCMLMPWDGWFVGADNSHIVKIDHDERIDVLIASKEGADFAAQSWK